MQHTPLSTPVPLPSLPPLLYAHHIVSLGSCFAEAMGQKLQEHAFSIEVNPYGALYNPLSLLHTVERILLGTPPDFASRIVPRDHGYCHLDCHSTLWAPTPEELLHTLSSLDQHIRQTLHSAQWLLLTLGSAWVHTLSSGYVVSNCHRITTPGYFTQRLLTPDEIINALLRLASLLHEYNPHLTILLTVSPIRHLHQGAQANTVSKGLLSYGAYQLTQQLPYVHYVPIYEILLDELRDYRYYAPNLTHPAELTLTLLWERLQHAWFHPTTLQICHIVKQFNNTLRHRPLHPTPTSLKKREERLIRLSSHPLLTTHGITLLGAHRQRIESLWSHM